MLSNNLDFNSQIKHIETKYPVDQINWNGIPVYWNIRNHIYAKASNGASNNVQLTKKHLVQLFTSAFVGLFKWFIKYDTWVFSSTANRRLHNRKWLDKFFDDPTISGKSTCFIELPIYKHLSPSHSQNIRSRALLLILELVYSKVFLRNSKLQGAKIIQQIESELGVSIDANGLAKKMVAEYKIMCFILRFNRPKQVYISTPYTNYGYVLALKEAGIKVFEWQHGVISAQHYGYNCFVVKPKTLEPDALLTFGVQEKKILKTSIYIPQDQIIPIGSYFLELLNSDFVKSDSIQSERNNYQHIIAVSLQDCPTGMQFFEELISLAKVSTQILFLLVPRRTTVQHYQKNFKIPENMVFSKLDVYRTIQNADLHLTAYSSCVLEAPALGIANALWNIEGKAKAYYLEQLPPSAVNFYFEKIEELQGYLAGFQKQDPDVIKESHKNVILPNYSNNIKQFFANAR